VTHECGGDSDGLSRQNPYTTKAISCPGILGDQDR